VRTTICIRSFNRPKELLVALESCFEQSVECRVIIVDDGSNLATQNIIRDSTEAKQNVDIVFLPENLGPSNALNVAIASAATEFLGFLDCDDTLLPEFVERMQLALDQNPWAEFAYCRFVGGPSWKISGTNLFREVLKSGTLSANGTLFGYARSFRTLPKLPTRQELHTLDYNEDDRLSFEIARNHGIVHVPEELYVYRTHSGYRLSADFPKMLLSWKRFLEDYQEDYEKHLGALGFGVRMGQVFGQYGSGTVLAKDFLGGAISFSNPRRRIFARNFGFLWGNLGFRARKVLRRFRRFLRWLRARVAEFARTHRIF